MGPVRTLQVIVGAMVIGCLAFLAVAVAAGPQTADSAPGDHVLLTYLALAWVLVSLVAGSVVAGVVAASGRRRLAGDPTAGGPPGRPTASPEAPPSSLTGLFSTGTIIRSAVLEGGALFAVVAYLVEGHRLALVAAAVGVAALLVGFPTEGRFREWAERQQEHIARERSTAG